MDLKKYYGVQGDYLKEHKKYFSKKQLQKDVDFMISALKLNKGDKILDVACGNGRHTVELAKRGFDMNGLDFSEHLLGLAKKSAARENLKINFYKQDIHHISIKNKYDKIFLFFSEFGLFDGEKVLKNISKILKPRGLFLLDCDNIFRLIQYLIKNQESPYQFDFINMELKEKQKTGQGVRYYIVPELKKMLNDRGLKVISIYGNYEKQKIDINSQRIILIGQKI